VGTEQPRYKLTPSAKEDIKEIWFHSVNCWGNKQAEEYIYQLENKFEILAENPELGRRRLDVHQTYRSLHVGSHVIFYLINEGFVEIIGIPHASMDVLNYFE